MGDYVLEFGRILDYKDELLRTNPGFDAMKKSFLAGCRRCIGLDGCFLKGLSKGQLLVDVCKDGKNQMLPLAWAVVEVENKFTWAWFVKLLKEDLQLGDGTDLTIISDMQKIGIFFLFHGLEIAITDHLPNVEHRMCARHILANWSKRWRSLERKKCFWRCARWSKLYFNFTSKCDVVDNNMAECFNSWILAARHKTIITMLEEIRVKMMKRIGQMREFCNTWICDISPMAMKVLQDNTTKSMKCSIGWKSNTGYEDSFASKTRMVGMGVIHTQSGATIINPGMPSERFRNVKSSAFVTGDLGHKPTCGVKWKGKQDMTSSQLEEMKGRKQIETRSKAAHLSQESSNAHNM
ncbi:hypothetical protein KY289_005721 [Solanum tuberosum]|nr:hypothetical protein KY289_005721 [Solanum tuberosum]